MTVQAKVTAIALRLEFMCARKLLWVFGCLDHEDAWVGSESRAACWL